jgi:excisionase family DNA binding protein
VGKRSGWLSSSEAAAFLGVSQRTVYSLIDAGDIPAYRVGRVIRVRTQELEAYRSSVRIAPGTLRHLHPERSANDRTTPHRPRQQRPHEQRRRRRAVALRRQLARIRHSARTARFRAPLRLKLSTQTRSRVVQSGIASTGPDQHLEDPLDARRPLRVSVVASAKLGGFCSVPAPVRPVVPPSVGAPLVALQYLVDGAPGDTACLDDRVDRHAVGTATGPVPATRADKSHSGHPDGPISFRVTLAPPATSLRPRRPGPADTHTHSQFSTVADIRVFTGCASRS